MTDAENVAIVVDPDAKARGDFRVALSRSGFRAVCAADSPAALRLVSRYHPDVVVTEIDLPTLDGFRFAERLRSQDATRNVGIVAVTNYAGDDLARRAAEAGIDAVVRKPCAPDHFARRVREASRRLRDEASRARELLAGLSKQVHRTGDLIVAAHREMAAGRNLLDRFDSALGSANGLEDRERVLLVEADGARDVMIADPERGEQLFDVLIERYDDHPLLYFKRGEAFRAIGQRKLAHHDFLTAAGRLSEGPWRERAHQAARRTRSHHERPTD